MRQMIAYLPLLASLAACTATTTQVNEPPSLTALWRVVDWQTVAADWSRESVLLDWRQLPRANANAGCNMLRYEVQQPQAQQVRIGAIASTRMACGDKSQLEMDVVRALGQHTFDVRFDGQDLLLRNEQGEMLRLRRE